MCCWWFTVKQSCFQFDGFSVFKTDGLLHSSSCPSCPKKLVRRCSHRKVDLSFKCRRRTAESWPEELDLLCVLMLVQKHLFVSANTSSLFCCLGVPSSGPSRVPASPSWSWTRWYHGQRPNVKRLLGDCVSFQQLPRKHLIASCPITSDPSATWPLLKRPYLPYTSLYAGIKTNSN